METLIAIAKEKKAWAALVRELLGHKEKQESKNKKKKTQEKSDVFMVANGYLLHKGAWIHIQEFEERAKQVVSSNIEKSGTD